MGRGGLVQVVVLSENFVEFAIQALLWRWNYRWSCCCLLHFLQNNRWHPSSWTLKAILLSLVLEMLSCSPSELFFQLSCSRVWWSVNLVSRYMELFMQIGWDHGALLLVISCETCRHVQAIFLRKLRVGCIEALWAQRKSGIDSTYAILLRSTQWGDLSEVVFEAVIVGILHVTACGTSITVWLSARNASFRGGSVHGVVEEVMDNSFLLCFLLSGKVVADLLH